MGIAIRHATTRQTTPHRAVQSKWLLLAALAMAALALAQRPDAIRAPSGAAATTRAMQLQIGAAGGYRLDGKPITRDGLERALRMAHGQSPQLRLRIESGDRGDPQQLMGALALADQAGIRNVGTRVQ